MALEDILPKSFFFAGDPTDPQANLMLRQRIAMEMMKAKRPYPKTLGEGLAAVGDALGEYGMSRRLQQMDVDAQKAGQAAEESVKPPAGKSPIVAPVVPSKVSYAPATDDTESDQPAPMLATRSLATPPATVPADTPVRLNPDGTIAGNLTAPTEPAEQPQAAEAPQATPPPEPDTGVAPSWQDRFQAAFARRLPQALAEQRDKVAAAAMPPAQGVPQANPMLAGQIPASLRAQIPTPTTPSLGGRPTDQRLAFNGLPQGVATDAPVPLPPEITQAPKPPPTQIAQAPQQPMTPQDIARMPVPPPQFDYVTPALRPPVPPPITPQSDIEQKAQAAFFKNAGNPYAQQRLQAIMDEEKQKRLLIDAQKKAQFDADVQNFSTLMQKRQEQVGTQAERGTAGIKSTVEADVARRTAGLGNEVLIAPLQKSAEAVKGLPAATMALRNARDQLQKGIFQGTLANQQLALAKTRQLVGGMFGLAPDDPRIANTETFKATIMPLVAQARSATSGNANISDADIELALSAVGGNITLDAKTFPRVLNALERINLGMAMGHQERVAAAGAGNPTASTLLQGAYGLPMEQIIPPRLIERLRQNPQTAAEFDAYFKTPGLARRILGR